MKNAILIHGCCEKEEFFSDEYPSGSNSHWFPWLQKQLMKEGIATQTPEMPTPYSPEYQEWKKVLESFPIGPETILVGHSCGAGFLIRWLGETGARVAKLILVAPWLDSTGQREGFLDFQIKPLIKSQVDQIHLLHSQDESVKGVKESVDAISAVFPEAEAHTFEDFGHFTYEDMGTEKFPALLEIVLK